MVGLPAASNKGDGFTAVLVHYSPELLADLARRSIPVHLLGRAIRGALQRREDALVVMLIGTHGLSLVTDVASAERVLFVGPHLHNAVIFNLNLNAATITAHDASGGLPITVAHAGLAQSLPLPSAGIHAIEQDVARRPVAELGEDDQADVLDLFGMIVAPA